MARAATGGVEKYVSATMKRRILAGDEPAWMARHKRRAYIVKAYLSAPLWARSSDFAALRDEARRLTAETGEPHVLDHVIPLGHAYVSGLTVPWNIAVVPHRVNVFKSNRFAPDQIELAL